MWGARHIEKRVLPLLPANNVDAEVITDISVTAPRQTTLYPKHYPEKPTRRAIFE